MAYRGTDPDRTNDRAGSPTYKSVALAWDGPPDPTETGPTGSQRVDLNPFFVAELMGLPADWLTPSHLGGNGLVPQAAAAAFTILTERLREP